MLRADAVCTTKLFPQCVQGACPEFLRGILAAVHLRTNLRERQSLPVPQLQDAAVIWREMTQCCLNTGGFVVGHRGGGRSDEWISCLGGCDRVNKEDRSRRPCVWGSSESD